jgi:hypothetical protein
MQTLTITKDFLTSNDCTAEILQDIATRHCKMETEQVAKLAKQGKLIGAVRKYLQDPNNGYAEMFNEDNLQLDIAALPDVVQEKPKGTRRATLELAGQYKVLNSKGCKAPPDSPKHKVYEILFNNNDFDTYMQKCKEASLLAVVIEGKKNKQLKITAQEFARWALKCGWIVTDSAQ